MFQTLRFALRTLGLRHATRMSPDRLARLQDRRLRGLVRFAVARSPFYRDKYYGLDLDRFTLAELPPTNKGELMAHFDRAVTDPRVRQAEVDRFIADPANLGRYFLGHYAVSHTSGSQGQPLVIVQDRWVLDLFFGMQCARGNAFTGVNPAAALRRLLNPARLAWVCMKPGFYPSASTFAYLPPGARSFLRLLSVSATDPDLGEKLHRFRPQVLTAYAGVLEMLALQADRLGLAPELRQAVNISEKLTERARARIEQAFGVPVLDDYASGECVFLTTGCPAGRGSHVNADWAILEVVDEDYRPVPAGQFGRKVLITNLANRVQPFLRYELGDVVELGPGPCPCGSRLPRVEGIEGRAADEFWVWDGHAYRPVVGNVIKNACDYLRGIREWQAVQQQRNRLLIRVEPLPGAALDREFLKRTLMKKLDLFGLPAGVAVDVQVEPSLDPDPATGKFRRFLSLVGEPPELSREHPRHEAQHAEV